VCCSKNENQEQGTEDANHTTKRFRKTFSFLFSSFYVLKKIILLWRMKMNGSSLIIRTKLPTQLLAIKFNFNHVTTFACVSI
jgi:hypothetical protein